MDGLDHMGNILRGEITVFPLAEDVVAPVGKLLHFFHEEFQELRIVQFGPLVPKPAIGVDPIVPGPLRRLGSHAS